MNAKQLITITVAALFLIGGATAVGAATPADQAPNTASDATNTDDADSETDSQPSAGPAAGIGPSGGLPEQVPDHVSAILDTIHSFQNGGIDNLGEALSSLVGGGPAENAGEASA